MANNWKYIFVALRRGGMFLAPGVWLWTALLSWPGVTMSAAGITGAVVNGTGTRATGGDEVILYRVDRSMHETAHTQTDAKGQFYFSAQGAGHFLVAVMHGRVAYHSAVLKGSSPVQVTVFDSVDALPTAYETFAPDITIFPELDGESLKVTEFFVYQNASHPAHTLLSQHTLDLALPVGSVLESIAAQPERTLPFPLHAIACGGVGRYRVSTAIRPGRTTLRVVYHSPVGARILVAQPFKQLSIAVSDNLDLLSARHTKFSLTSHTAGKRFYLVKSTIRCRPLTFRISREVRPPIPRSGETYRRPVWLTAKELPFTKLQSEPSASR